MTESIDAFTTFLQTALIPLNRVVSAESDAMAMEWLIARFDQVDPEISGNKAFKLLPHLKEAEKQGRRTLISFGGMYSNHLHALAFVGKRMGFKTIGVVRAYEGQPESVTLQEAREAGMHIIKVGKNAYREKHSIDFQKKLLDDWPDAYIIPEGGGGEEGIEGAGLMASLLQNGCKDPIDYLMVAAGTGTTLAGLIRASQNIPALKDTQFVGIAAVQDRDNIIACCKRAAGDSDQGRWQVLDDYTFGGFAKVDKALAQFMLRFEQENALMIEPVYTAKLFFAAHDLINKGFFKPHSRLVCLHTGGVQGRRGLIYKVNRLATS